MLKSAGSSFVSFNGVLASLITAVLKCLYGEQRFFRLWYLLNAYKSILKKNF